jgi:hypothetical protein
MKAESNGIPELIEQYGEYIYIRKDIEEIPATEERDKCYRYDEMLLKGYTYDFVEQNKDDIFANPGNYNVIQINGVYV